MPIGMRGKKTETTTLLPPSNPAKLTKSQKKRKRRNEIKKPVKTQPNKQIEKKEIEVDRKKNDNTVTKVYTRRTPDECSRSSIGHVPKHDT